MAKSQQNGFTLIELVVAIAVFSILSGIMLSNFRNDQNFRDLKLEAASVESLVKKAQNMALTGASINGVNYEKYSVNAASCNDGSCAAINLSGASAGTSSTLETLNLNKSSIEGISQNLNIEFWAPRAKATVNYNGVSTTSIDIKLVNLKEAALVKCVEFSSVSGRIGVVNKGAGNCN